MISRFMREDELTILLLLIMVCTRPPFPCSELAEVAMEQGVKTGCEVEDEDIRMT